MRKTRVKIHPMLQELKAELQTLYGTRLRSLVLFGSHARGEATPESDMDVLVVLQEARNTSHEASRLVPLIAKLNLKYGILLACLPIDLAEYEKGGTPLLRNVYREGVLIHRYLIDGFEDRHIADYGRTEDIGPDKASQHIKHAEAFLREAKKFLRESSK